MKKIRGKVLVATAVAAAFSAASGGAVAALFNPFQITETSVPGAAANQQTGDKITGNYNEVISFGVGNTFTVSLMWQAGQYLNNCNTACTLVPNQLGGVTANQYGLYALYQSSGTFATSGGGVTTFTDTPGSGSIHVFIDPTSNTTFTAPASGALPWLTASAGDDYNIANGTPLGGTGTLDPNLPTCGGGINCGSFGTTTSFFLTALGSQYFTLPIPFYNVSFQSGQLNNFTPTGTQTINGSLDVAFQPLAVPEPATLALVGIGLLGAGFARRWRQ